MPSGSTIARTDGNGQEIGRAEYSAYGVMVRRSGDMDTPFLFNGQLGVQTDSNGLLNMRARYYSPYLMRFLNSGPIGFSCGWTNSLPPTEMTASAPHPGASPRGGGDPRTRFRAGRSRRVAARRRGSHRTARLPPRQVPQPPSGASQIRLPGRFVGQACHRGLVSILAGPLHRQP